MWGASQAPGLPHLQVPRDQMLYQGVPPAMDSIGAEKSDMTMSEGATGGVGLAQVGVARSCLQGTS